MKIRLQEIELGANKEMIEVLGSRGVDFTGPKASHLGMDMIEFTDPDGHMIRVNQPTEASPSWLKI